MPPINERQWQGRVLQWTNELLKKYPELPFSKVERSLKSWSMVRHAGLMTLPYLTSKTSLSAYLS